MRFSAKCTRRLSTPWMLSLIVVAVVIIGLIIYHSWVDKVIVKSTSDYEKYLGEDGVFREDYFSYNYIFPYTLPNDADVEKFYYEYLNFWDPNYLGYLKLRYNTGEEYSAEIERLREIDSSKDRAFYGIESFPKELCAITVNQYEIVYAMTDAESKEIVYVLLKFCDGMIDIDYLSIIDDGDLPTGLYIKRLSDL